MKIREKNPDPIKPSRIFPDVSVPQLWSVVSRYRTELMGEAMLLVLVYHVFCWVYNPVGSFNIGYVGVDVFLFLSGLGLAESYARHSLSAFYCNRFVRLYPVYALAVVLTCFLILGSFACVWGGK